MTKCFSNITAIYLLVGVFISIGITSCSKKTSDPDIPQITNPVIKAVNIDSGTYNTPITITGENFQNKIADNIVKFNNHPAEIISATATKLVAKVPQDAGTGPISVIVNGFTATGPIFKYILPKAILTIATLSINEGSVGASVVITGTGFSAIPGNNHVYFNGKASIVSTAISTSLTVTVPVGATTGNLTVIVNGVTAIGPSFTIRGVPVITKLSEYSGAYNSGIKIVGVNFGTDIRAVKVYVNEKYADVLSVTDNEILFAVPRSAGSGLVKIVVNGVTVKGPMFSYLLSRQAFVTTIAGVDAMGNPTAFLKAPRGIAIDSLGNVFVSNTEQDNIKVINVDGLLSTFAGGSRSFRDGKGAAAAFFSPQNIAADTYGNIYVADSFNKSIRKITPDATVSTIYTGVYSPVGVTVDIKGNVYFSAPAEAVPGSPPTLILKITPDKKAAAFAGGDSPGYKDGLGISASFNGINGLATDRTGNVYVGDAINNVVRKITPQGLVSTFAGNGTEGSDNGNAKNASFDGPEGVAVDAAGNVYVIDAGSWRIRIITKEGVVSTLTRNSRSSPNFEVDGSGDFATFFDPYAIAVDASGKYIYIADKASSRIRKVTITIL